ncbi:PREDICTED: mitochondrial amidoxime-reducing component 1-like [Polistes dominula]|uniref:Mitochondrial amidoxime-reducing component 1-like n=1 Tax=Polistes dominula TaxID=743375 RepID=A0ABM1IZ35_POLDO|nr:PREDICTED: mitochondrial amidoxime-reducing component 1-like [Polistes dominula]
MFESDFNSRIVITCSIAVFLGILYWNLRSNSSIEKSKRKNPSNKSNGGCEQKSETNKTNLHETTSNDDCEEKIQTNLNETINKDCDDNLQIQVKKKTSEINVETKLNIPKLKWVKVGRVEELYYYPLKSGRGKTITECKFTEYGISVEDEGLLTLRDRMFMVYNEETFKFQTARHYPTMILVSLSAVDQYKVKLEAVGMPSVVFRVPEKSEKSSAAIACSMWFGEPVKCIDCGPEPAEWLSRFLTGTNSGLRLGYSMPDRREITKGTWERFAKVFNTMRDEDSGLFSDLTSYMLMTSKSLDNLNERLETPVPTLQFRPNIVVSNDEPFVEDNWEWIKIGDRAIIRNVKPCPRCKMTRIDPETGNVAKEEPLKTLYSFRKQTDPAKIALDGPAPLMGIYCGLYITGRVKLKDDVFVHLPEDTENFKLSNGQEVEI